MSNVATPTKPTPNPQARVRSLWLKSALLSGVIFLICLGYQLIYGYNFGFNTLNKVTAASAILLIGISFLQSPLAYFANFFDWITRYKKYLGLFGFYFALIHTALSIVLYFPPGFLELKGRDLFAKWSVLGIQIPAAFAFFFGMYAFAIFFFMALISNQTAMKRIGGALWKMLLRTGYLGLVMVAVHFLILNYAFWSSWIRHAENYLPPLSMLLNLYILIVLLARLILEVSIRKKKS